MTRACLTTACRRYSDAYISEGVSKDANELRVKPTQEALTDNSVTIGQRYAQLFQQIIDARASAASDDWDGDGAKAVSQQAVEAALVLSTAFPQNLPMPAVQPEPTGEITFEWYKDSRHVAVVAVDGRFVRWSALAGTDAPRSGAEPYLQALPAATINVIREVLA